MLCVMQAQWDSLRVPGSIVADDQNKPVTHPALWKGASMSIAILSNGVSITGSGTRGVLIELRGAALWHSLQDQQWSATSLYNVD